MLISDSDTRILAYPNILCQDGCSGILHRGKKAYSEHREQCFNGENHWLCPVVFSIEASSCWRMTCCSSVRILSTKGKALLLPREIRWKGVEGLWRRIVSTIFQGHDVL